MSEPKFSRGPWRVNSSIVRNDFGYIAQVYRHNLKADAALIAAAPKLYEALKSIFDAGEAGTAAYLDRFHEAARAALAKAEGREP